METFGMAEWQQVRLTAIGVWLRLRINAEAAANDMNTNPFTFDWKESIINWHLIYVYSSHVKNVIVLWLVC